MNSIYDSFLQYIRYELNQSAYTVLSYRSDLFQWHEYSVETFGEHFDPLQANVADLRLWIAHLSEQGLSIRTVRRKVQTLRAFFNYLLRHALVSDNPAMELQLGRLPKSLPKVVRKEDIKKIIDTPFNENDFEQLRNHLIITILYSTGMRASELLGLSIENIDLRKDELKVHGKRNKDRIIPFGKELHELILQYIPTRPSTESKLLFIETDGSQLKYRKLNAIVKGELSGRTTTPKKTPHVLRHSFATDMLNNGAEITAVQQLLGHASLATTQIYTHLSYKDLLKNYQLAHPRAQKKS